MKKKITKSIAIIFILLLVLIGFMISYVKIMLPDVGKPSDLKVDLSPEKIERGRYLANHVNDCIDCHSSRDRSIFSGPIIPGTEGA